MIFSISWHPKAAKYVHKLPTNVSKRILNKLDDVKKDPFRYLEHFEGEGYKLRIGEYRAIIDIDFTTNVLKIRLFDKRGRIYE